MDHGAQRDMRSNEGRLLVHVLSKELLNGEVAQLRSESFKIQALPSPPNLRGSHGTCSVFEVLGSCCMFSPDSIVAILILDPNNGSVKESISFTELPRTPFPFLVNRY
jgi:hypothetical protein